MRILLISRTLSLDLSAPKCNLNLAIALSKLNFRVHVLTSNMSNDARRELIKHNISFTYIDKSLAQKYVAPVFYTAVAKRIKMKHDIVITIGNGYTLGDDITWVHFPRVAWERISSQYGIKVSKRFKFEALMEKILFKTSNFLWAPSTLVSRDLEKYYGIAKEKIIHIPHGVDPEYYTPLPEDVRSELRKEQGIDTKLIALFIGDPVYKGLKYVVEALDLLSSGELKDIKVFVISNKNIKLPEHVTRVINYVGSLSPDKLKSMYQIADVLLLPSLYDAFGLVVLEAMASGVIPIISEHTGAKDIVLREHIGFVIGLSPEFLAEKICYLLNKETSLKTLRRKSRVVAEKHSWLNIAGSLSKELKNVFVA